MVDVKMLRRELDKLSHDATSEWLRSLNKHQLTELEFDARIRDRRISSDDMPKDICEKFYGKWEYYFAARRPDEHVRESIDCYVRTKSFWTMPAPMAI